MILCSSLPLYEFYDMYPLSALPNSVRRGKRLDWRDECLCLFVLLLSLFFLHQCLCLFGMFLNLFHRILFLFGSSSSGSGSGSSSRTSSIRFCVVLCPFTYSMTRTLSLLCPTVLFSLKSRAAMNISLTASWVKSWVRRDKPKVTWQPYSSILALCTVRQIYVA
ncbi:unnamed protein product, partial [Prunus brigantina]